MVIIAGPRSTHTSCGKGRNHHATVKKTALTSIGSYKEYVQLTCDAFQCPAESLDGVLAKARLAYRISVGMGDTEGPVEDMTPPDCGELDDRMLLWSILRDLERLVSSETKRRRDR